MLSRTASPVVAVRPAEVVPAAPALSVAVPLPTALAMLVSAGICQLAQGGPDAGIDWSTLSIDNNASEPSWACVSLNPAGWCDGQTVSVAWCETREEAEDKQDECQSLGILGSHIITTADRARAFLQGDGWLELFV